MLYYAALFYSELEWNSDMAGKPTSVSLDERTRERLDRVARAYDRKRSWIIARAIQEYLDREEAFARAVEAGIESAGRGELVAHTDVMAEMAGKPKEEGEKWMAEAKKRFEAA